MYVVFEWKQTVWVKQIYTRKNKYQTVRERQINMSLGDQGKTEGAGSLGPAESSTGQFLYSGHSSRQAVIFIFIFPEKLMF